METSTMTRLRNNENADLIFYPEYRMVCYFIFTERGHNPFLRAQTATKLQMRVPFLVRK